MTQAASPAADPANMIAFQGAPGAYSDLSCRGAYPAMTTLPCASFEDTFAAVRDGKAALAMIPIENSIAGRVADSSLVIVEGAGHMLPLEAPETVNQAIAAWLSRPAND